MFKFNSIKLGDIFYLRVKHQTPGEEPTFTYSPCKKDAVTGYVNLTETLLGEQAYNPSEDHNILTIAEYVALTATTEVAAEPKPVTKKIAKKSPPKKASAKKTNTKAPAKPKKVVKKVAKKKARK